MEYLTQEYIATYAFIVSLLTLLISIRALEKSKSAEKQAFQKNALESLFEWRSLVRKVDWESLFVEREIDELLAKNNGHKELLMWRTKITNIRKLPESTLEVIEGLRLNAENSNNNNLLHRLIIDSNHGKLVANDTLSEMSYIREALENFNPDHPRYYRGN